MTKRTNNFFIALSILLISVTIYGQDRPSIIDHEIYPNWYYFNQEEDNQRERSTSTPLLVRDFVPTYMSEFNLNSNNELRVKSISYFDDQMNPVSTGSVQRKITNYQQYYKDYEVEAATIVVQDEADTITLVIGSTLNTLNIDTSNPISESSALNSALNAIQDTYIWQDSTLMNGFCVDDSGIFDSTIYNQFLPQGKLCLACRFGDTFTSDNYKFVWSFVINTVSAEYRVLVNAKTGVVYDVADVTVRGTYGYGDVQTLYDGYITGEMETYKPFLLKWRLENSNGNITQLNGNKVKSSNNIWTDLTKAPATTAHWIIGQLADFYIDEYDINLAANVYINAGLQNCVSEYRYYPDVSMDVINLGSKDAKWMSTIDIVGHELAHKFLNLFRDWHYTGETGALYESYADIYATLVERDIKTKHGRAWNWTIGEDAVTLRSMSNPNSYFHPDYYGGLYWVDPWNYNDGDNGGIHTNCGVQNKWFYTLSQSIGVDKAKNIVFVTLNYLPSNARYHDALFGSVFAAEYIFGECSNERNAVIRAWNTVGVSSENLQLCNNNNPVDKSSVYDMNSKKIIDIMVYPNPTSDIINIEVSCIVKNCTAILYNIMGNKINETPVNDHITTIETTKLANGLYFINVVADGEVIKNTKVFVKHEL